jgi:hypothetical protein
VLANCFEFSICQVKAGNLPAKSAHEYATGQFEWRHSESWESRALCRAGKDILIATGSSGRCGKGISVANEPSVWALESYKKDWFNTAAIFSMGLHLGCGYIPIGRHRDCPTSPMSGIEQQMGIVGIQGFRYQVIAVN